MNKHVESMVKKTRSKLGILHKIWKFISKETSISIYKVMIRPHMEYDDSVKQTSGEVHSIEA